MAVERNYPVIPEVSRSVQAEFRTIRTALYDAQDKLEQIQNLNPKSTVSAGSSNSGSNPGNSILTGGGAGSGGGTGTPATPGALNLSQFIGLLAQAQRAYIPEYTSIPLLADPISQDGALVSVNGILYRFSAQPLPGAWTAQAAIAALLQDTYAHWVSPAYDPANFALGTVFLDTTRNILYDVRTVTGANTWVYTAGVYIAATASRPTTGFNGAALGANDTGLLFIDSTLTFAEYWNGAAWVQYPGVPASALVLASNSSHQIIAAALASADIWVGNASNLPIAVALSGDATLSNAGVLTLATVNSNVGSFTSANITVDGKGRITAAASGGGTSGFSGTATLAALTALGTQGSITFVNGLATAYSAPT